ncbi:hypothetical protein C8J56DRAFT_1045766 [Mycena floridula]|nr:hypothetical protein C8J56DRAFT_1045766 [Mycena floridula]
MLPAANLNLRGLYDTTVEFFALRSPSLSSTRDFEQEPTPDTGRRISCNRVSFLSSPQASMRRELDETRKELARSKLDASRAEERCRMLEKVLNETRELLRIKDAEIQRLTSGATPAVIERQNSAESSYSDLDEGFSQVDEEIAHKKGRDYFLTRTDGGWSGAQLLQLVNDLNSEILQFSASATELCKFERHHSKSSIGQATQEVSARMGQSVAQILSSRDHSQDPILVQLVLQGSIVACIKKALSAFCMGFPSKHDVIVSQIYSHIYVAMPQPTSSRWRALTHRHIHSMYPFMNDYALNELAESIYRWCSDVFCIAGSNTTDKASPASKDGLRSRFGDQIRRIAKTVSLIAQVTRQEIMSTNFEIVTAGPGDKFDTKKMSDAFGDYSPSTGAILVTTELGLRCTTRRDNQRDEVAEVETRLLLQPKVVLDSVLDFMDPR